MEKKYDIFISYRREGGYDTAKHLNDLLVRDGYSVSFDIDTLRSGDFDKQLYKRIDTCKDFILIVDKNAFDRTIIGKIPKEHDWLRCELAYALEKNKNIIPVFLSGVKEFPNNLPNDIIGVTKKNGPEYNRYYFNDFYRELKTRFLHSRNRTNYMYFLAVALVCALVGVYFFLNNAQRDDSVNVNDKIPIGQTTQKQDNVDGKTRDEILKLYTGSFTIVAPGAMKEGITWVYFMELDPVNSKCKWVEEDFVDITDSKGFCGTEMQGAEAWEVYSFSLHNSLRYAILEMREVDDFYEGENRTCKIKLEHDSYNNLKMSFIEGTSAPAPLYDEQGTITNVVTFYKD